MDSKSRFGFALEYVADIDATRRFYTDVLGMAVEREHPTFVQFKDATGSHFAIASDEAMGNRDERELYWLVDDADAAFSTMSKQAAVTMPVKEMPFGKVFGIKDPAGYPCFVVELARQRPSRVVS
jgi:catechol 2,3-dioxygenase-like lactoylglutathione lyase family enzyme